MIEISSMFIPALIFYVVATGISMKKDIYRSFTQGAKSGLNTVVSIIPTLIGLMIAVGVLRASGFLEFFSSMVSRVLDILAIEFPTELISLFIVKIFSSSAATGLALDIYKQYGTDSYIGLVTSILLASTETVFYTLSVYFLSVKVTKSRWTLMGALVSSVVGLIASILIVNFINVG